MKHILFLLCLCLLPLWTEAACFRKLDVAPVYIHLDVLQSGKTIRSRDIFGGRADLNYVFDKGIGIKGNFMGGAGDRTHFWNAMAGLGFCYPITSSWSVFPYGGAVFGRFESKYKLEVAEGVKVPVKEKLQTISPVAGLDLSYKICEGWRTTFTFQYSWSTVYAKIKPFVDSKSRAQGPSYSLQLEKDITDCWSINAGVGYNLSISKEKHGLRATGVKLGVGYWF